MTNPEPISILDTNSTPHSHSPHQQTSTHNETHKIRRRPRAAMHRLNVHIPEILFRDLERLSEEEGRTMTEIIRLGLGLAHLATTEKKKGGTLAIIDHDGVVHKVVLS